MKFIAITALSAALAATVAGVPVRVVPTYGIELDESKLPAVTQEQVDIVNAAQTTWVAEKPSRFEGISLATLRKMQGVLPKPDGLEELPVKKVEIIEDLPTEFDARTAWPQCTSIADVRDQASCGSCWAVAASEVVTDRTCIGYNATKGNIRLSAQDITSCCGGTTCFGCQGCNGGQPSEALKYFHYHGVVDGFTYQYSSNDCLDYALPHCNHHEGGPYPNCTEGGSTPSCHKQCSNGKDWTASKHKGEMPYSVPNDEQSIMSELMKNGPMEAAFSVYSDFPTYKSGVYQYTSGSYLGGHAVKLMGWGEDNGVPYWLVANSWNKDWGLDGTFKILRGNTEASCGFQDSLVAAGAPTN